MYENCRNNKYFLIYLVTEVRNNDSITKIWLCEVMSEKRGWQITKSPPLNLPLIAIFHFIRNVLVLLKYITLAGKTHYDQWKIFLRNFHEDNYFVMKGSRMEHLQTLSQYPGGDFSNHLGYIGGFSGIDCYNARFS